MALNFTPRTWVAGAILTAAQLNAEVRDSLLGIQAVWTDYTPVVEAGGTPITLGNGDIDAAYMRIGKTIHFRFKLTVGSTTNLGSGTLQIDLPVASTSIWSTAGAYATAVPIGAGSWRLISASRAGFVIGGATSGATIASLGLANGSFFSFGGSYEAA